MQDLIAGRTDYQCSLAAVAIPQIEGNQIKALAILSKDRSPILPALASAHEQGLADFDAAAWNAFFLPKGTPAAIVKKLNDATIATMQTPSVQQRLKELGATVVAPERRSPNYLQTFVAHEIEKWAVTIRAAGVTAQ
jgi:tripartite-type tricarboxylate transporter receptor subunit TctC